MQIDNGDREGDRLEELGWQIIGWAQAAGVIVIFWVCIAALVKAVIAVL